MEYPRRDIEKTYTINNRLRLRGHRRVWSGKKEFIIEAAFHKNRKLFENKLLNC